MEGVCDNCMVTGFQHFLFLKTLFSSIKAIVTSISIYCIWFCFKKIISIGYVFYSSKIYISKYFFSLI